MACLRLGVAEGVPDASDGLARLAVPTASSLSADIVSEEPRRFILRAALDDSEWKMSCGSAVWKPAFKSPVLICYFWK
jgi:hypothetical protein